MTRVPLLRGSLMALLALGAVWGCQSPEAFHITGDGSLLNSESSGGADGVGGDTGTGGMIAMTGGMVGSGGQAAGGKGGAPGSGGATTGSGGATGGSSTGGKGGATASGGAGGATTGSGGATGGSSTGGKGGTTASGGAGGATTGSGGATGGSSAGGKGGTGGAGGGKGGSGAGGTVATGPCAGLCTDPVIFPGPAYSSPNLGTGATCHQTMASIQGGNCSNIPSPRTFKVNDVAVTCNGGNWTLPAKRMGGYCFQASAGNPAYSAFVTF